METIVFTVQYRQNIITFLVPFNLISFKIWLGLSGLQSVEDPALVRNDYFLQLNAIKYKNNAISQ